MIYVCSLKNDQKAFEEGKIILGSIVEVYKVIPSKETQEIIIKDDFLEKYFTPQEFASFATECRKINRFLEITYNPKYSLAASVKNQLPAQRKLGNMNLELWEMKNLREREQLEHSKTKKKLARVSAELDAMVCEMACRFGRAADVDKYAGIEVTDCSYHKILYIKEITRVHYVDTLLYYLQEIIKWVKMRQTRLLVIEAAYGEGRAALYDNCKAYNELPNEDILDDNIFIAGFHPGIIKNILKNPEKAEYLIVLDRSGFESAFITGNKVELLYTASEAADVQDHEAQKPLISYGPPHLYIPFIKNFKELDSEEQANKYYSMEITKRILELLEEMSS